MSTRVHRIQKMKLFVAAIHAATGDGVAKLPNCGPRGSKRESGSGLYRVPARTASANARSGRHFGILATPSPPHPVPASPRNTWGIQCSLNNPSFSACYRCCEAYVELACQSWCLGNCALFSDAP